MPEGHTIHRLAADLDKHFGGGPVSAGSPQGRFDVGADRLDGSHCVDFEAFGKHLVGNFDIDDERSVLHVHLGLIGKFRKARGEPVGAVRLRLSNGDTHWDLRGPMVCRLGGPELLDEVAESVGPDPLRDAGDGSFDVFRDGLRRRRIAIGAALLNQKLIAGIGNVYRSELLFLARVDPRTPANRMADDDVRFLWDESVRLLALGKRLNRIVTVDPFDAGYPTVRSIPRGERLHVYKRDGEPCRTCATPIDAIEVGGRTLWECPTCQR